MTDENPFVVLAKGRNQTTLDLVTIMKGTLEMKQLRVAPDSRIEIGVLAVYGLTQGADGAFVVNDVMRTKAH